MYVLVYAGGTAQDFVVFAAAAAPEQTADLPVQAQSCNLSDMCFFAHGAGQLRAPEHEPSDSTRVRASLLLVSLGSLSLRSATLHAACAFLRPAPRGPPAHMRAMPGRCATAAHGWWRRKEIGKRGLSSSDAEVLGPLDRYRIVGRAS